MCIYISKHKTVNTIKKKKTVHNTLRKQLKYYITSETVQKLRISHLFTFFCINENNI